MAEDETRTTVARDGCVVDTPPLAAMLSSFTSRWRSERPSTSGRFEQGRERRTSVEMVTPLEWLSAETGIPSATIQNVAAGRYPTTELRIADPLVAALNQPQAWHDGRLQVRPNPLATRAARAQCCSGSLTGSAALDAIAALYG